MSDRARQLVGDHTGETVRQAFPARDTLPSVTLIDAVYDSGIPMRLVRPLWSFIDYDRGPLPLVRIDIVPVFKDEDSQKVVAAGLHICRFDEPCDHISMIEGVAPHLAVALPNGTTDMMSARMRNAEANSVPGVLEMMAGSAAGLGAQDRVALMEIRLAARDAVEQAAAPLLDELRSRMNASAPSLLRSPREYRH